jgi:hypothetical protein
VGGSISRSSVRRVTQGFGQRLSEQKEREAEQASAIAAVEESPQDRRVPLWGPIVEKGNVSSDGTMILLRGEGWKEAKMAAFSEVEVLEAGSQKRRSAQREGKRAGEEVVRLQGHSDCAGVWDADTFEQYQYAEGLRRGLDLLEQLSSVNDGALWIERTTFTNFPEARQVIDWGHVLERLWAVAHAVYGEGETAKEWLKPREGALWDGGVEQVIEALEALNLDQPGYPDEVRQAPGYFRHNRDRMRYDVFRALGYPIGSGTVESGAKNVVKHRMRRPGRGWKRGCAQAMLAGLSELHSGRFDWAWQQVYRRAAKVSESFELYPWKGRVFGYKVHTILCRWSYLPLLFVVTPANCNDGPLAIPMFTAVLLLYQLRIRAVWADAAYFNYAFLGFVHDVLHASVNVDYNLRRQGKRFLATLFFVRQWRDLMSPRANIERHFAWLKRYFGLKYFRVQGYAAVIQFVFRVYIAALIVAFIAARYQRPELATSRLKVLAFVNT